MLVSWKSLIQQFLVAKWNSFMQHTEYMYFYCEWNTGLLIVKCFLWFCYIRLLVYFLLQSWYFMLEWWGCFIQILYHLVTFQFQLKILILKFFSLALSFSFSELQSVCSFIRLGIYTSWPPFTVCSSKMKLSHYFACVDPNIALNCRLQNFLYQAVSQVDSNAQ